MHCGTCNEGSKRTSQGFSGCMCSRLVYDVGLVPDFSSVSIPCRYQTRGPYLADDDCFTLSDLVFPNGAAIKILVGDAFAPDIPLDLRSVESLVIATNGAAGSCSATSRQKGKIF